ncbi:MAG: methionyl-tRNA formyltransferase, partial [bacterium]
MPKNKIKICFFGTPDFGAPALLGLLQDNDFEVVCVVAQPDKKTGRKQILTPPPIKTIALKYNIPVFQPKNVNKEVEVLKKYKPDLIIVAAYAQIISEEILNLPEYGCVNIHGSLLPKYRGASCVQAAIINGDKESG